MSCGLAQARHARLGCAFSLGRDFGARTLHAKAICQTNRDSETEGY